MNSLSSSATDGSHEDLYKIVKVFMATLNSAGATPHQQLPSMSSLVFISISNSPSAWVWSQTASLATQSATDFAASLPKQASVGKLSATSLASSKGSNTANMLLEQTRHPWGQVCTTEADFTSAMQFCHAVPHSSMSYFHLLNGTLGGHVRMPE